MTPEQLAEIEARVTACGACGGGGIIATCCGDASNCTQCPKPEPCDYCGRTGKTDDDEDAIALIAAVRERDATIARAVELLRRHGCGGTGTVHGYNYPQCEAVEAFLAEVSRG